MPQICPLILNLWQVLQDSKCQVVQEVNKRVAQALSYRTDLLCFLSRVLEKDPPHIKDTLEMDPVEDLNKKGDSPPCGISFSALCAFTMLEEANEFGVKLA
eukprot:Gb_36897 [translate_table: standard]